MNDLAWWFSWVDWDDPYCIDHILEHYGLKRGAGINALRRAREADGIVDDDVSRFLAQNHNLTESAPGLLFRFQKFASGKIRFLIEIAPDTTQADFRNPVTWKVVEQWRDRLNRWQGLDYTEGRESRLEDLYQRKMGGESYRRLAVLVNSWVAADLKEFYTEVMDLKAALARYKTWDELTYSWVYKTRCTFLGLDGAVEILRKAGMLDIKIAGWIQEGYANILQGREPFGPPENLVPITPDKIKELLRYWKRKREGWKKSPEFPLPKDGETE